jgi:hypothetical protein
MLLRHHLHLLHLARPHPHPAYGNVACALFLLLSAFVVPDVAFHWQALTTRAK